MSSTSHLQTTKGGRIFKILEILFTALVTHTVYVKTEIIENISVHSGLFRIIFLCVCVFSRQSFAAIHPGWYVYIPYFMKGSGEYFICRFSIFRLAPLGFALCYVYANECINAIPSLLHLNIYIFFFIYRMVHPNISKVSDMWLNNSFVVAVAFDVDFLSKCLLSVFRSEAMQTLWQLDVWISPTHKLANIYSMQINHNGKCIDFGSYQRYQKLLKPTGYLKRKTWTNSSYHMVYWIWLPRM